MRAYRTLRLAGWRQFLPGIRTGVRAQLARPMRFAAVGSLAGLLQLSLLALLTHLGWNALTANMCARGLALFSA